MSIASNKWYAKKKNDIAFMEKRRQQGRNWRRANPVLAREISKKNRAKLKSRVMAIYGDTCISCGIQEMAVLTLDHINNDGAIERKKSNALYQSVIRAGKRLDLQCMCFNCNLGRKNVYGSEFSTWPSVRLTTDDSVPIVETEGKHRDNVPNGTYASSGERHRAWRKLNAAKIRNDRLQRKLKALQKYGGKCIACHTNEVAVLTIDHKNNNGKEDRAKVRGSAFHEMLSRQDRRDDLQCMCYNCNLGRKKVYGADFATWPNSLA